MDTAVHRKRIKEEVSLKVQSGTLGQHTTWPTSGAVQGTGVQLSSTVRNARRELEIHQAAHSLLCDTDAWCIRQSRVQSTDSRMLGIVGEQEQDT